MSIPIMIGSAVQNIITLTDLFFLGRVGKTELAAIGLVGVFYLMITTIGYSFSKGGQIIIARRMGEGREDQIGKLFYSMLLFELSLSLIMFLFMQFGASWFFSLLVKAEDQDVLHACLDYIYYRSFGVFFSYAGVAMVALYSGVARTNVIIYNAIALGILNLILNYGLIFGNLGLPAMGIGGSGLASSLAEGIAFLVFITYIYLDREADIYGLFGRFRQRKAFEKKQKELNETQQEFLNKNNFLQFDSKAVSDQIKVSAPIVLQSLVGQGSWLIFFTLVEQIMGKHELAISNIIRAVYLLYMIPCWGFASGINTIVSNLMGQNKLQEVQSAIGKAARLSLSVTGILAILLVIAPRFVLLIGTNDIELINDSIRLIWLLVVILLLYSTSAIYYNGLVGTGATKVGLQLQVFSVAIYLLYTYYVIVFLKSNLEMAWLAEFVYWAVILVCSLWYLRSGKWKHIKV